MSRPGNPRAPAPWVPGPGPRPRGAGPGPGPGRVPGQGPRAPSVPGTWSDMYVVRHVRGRNGTWKDWHVHGGHVRGRTGTYMEGMYVEGLARTWRTCTWKDWHVHGGYVRGRTCT